MDIRKWLDTDRRTRIGSWRDCCRRAVRPWSRCLARVIGFEVHDSDSAEHAAHLARRTALAEGLHAMPTRPVLHGDNGASLKATMVLAMLHWLGIRPIHSRPRVSDGNAFAGQCSSCSGTTMSTGTAADPLRYPGTASCRIGSPSAQSPPRGLSARERNPRRWSGKTRNWTPVSVVTLNPERDAYVQAAASQIQLCSIGEPVFPVPTWQRPSHTEHNGGDGRRGAARSHAQRISLREHGEDGKHRPSPQ